MTVKGGVAAVAAETLTKSFGNGRVVDGVSFTVERGSCFGILGPNGAGKSTILKMIYGFIRPSSGRVRVDGLDVAQRTRDVKRLLGVAPQEDTLDPDLSVLENLLFQARYFGFSRRESALRARELLEMMGLDSHEGDAVGQLSAGMRRRLLLARAHLNDPSVIILDEPTRGLDASARSFYFEYLAGLKKSGAAIVVATHDLAEAVSLCDRAAIIEGGRLIEAGGAMEVIRSAGERPPLRQLLSDGDN